jgi:hypothetical protein
VIRDLPPDKAPGSDCFTARFLQVAMPIIRADFMQVFDALRHLDTRNLHTINQALLVLLPKFPKACVVKDIMLISLIHIVGELLSKALANQLAPRLGELIHPSQSKFIKGHMIHDSFCFVQASARLLSVRRQA